MPKDVVEFIVRQLVDNQDQVNVTCVSENGIDRVTVKVAANETGKIIGKKGRIANAIRTVLKAVGSKTNTRIEVDIVDE